MLRSFYFRPVQFRGLIFLGLLMLALAILGSMVWRNMHHFQTVISYVNYSHRIHNVSVGLQQSVIEYLTEAPQNSTPIALAKMLEEMDSLKNDFRYLTEPTKKSLDIVRDLLTHVDRLGKDEKHDRLISALKIMSKMLNEEGLQREKLLEDISLDSQSELITALAIFVLILLGAMLFLKRRILHPLNDLTKLLEQLTEGN
jgi:two-component system, NtrC family, sensor kinase